MKILKIASLLSLCLFASCSSEDDPETTNCSGTLVESTVGNACVFQQELIEEGFMCPSDFAFEMEFTSGAIGCRDQEILTPELEAELISNGYDPEVRTETVVRFRLNLQKNQDKDIFIREVDENGQPGWFQLTRDDAPVLVAPPCGRDWCDGGQTPACESTPLVNWNPDNERSIEFAWDGFAYSGESCVGREAVDTAATGWNVEFCHGNLAEGDEITDNECIPVDFPGLPEVAEYTFEYNL